MKTSEKAHNPHKPEHRGVAYCPHCGAKLPTESLIVELWEADETIHHLWCSECDFTCDVVQSDVVTAHEPE